MMGTNSVASFPTLETFLAYPETKPASEYFQGKIFQKPMPQGEHSILQTRLSQVINKFSQPQNIALALTEIRCTFGRQSIVPDLAVFNWERIPKTETGRIQNRFETYPDWVIEILSPQQSANQVIKKILFCLNQGTSLGWFIDSEDESVMTFQPNQLPSVCTGVDILPVLKSLETLQLRVNQLFGWLTL